MSTENIVDELHWLVTWTGVTLNDIQRGAYRKRLGKLPEEDTVAVLRSLRDKLPINYKRMPSIEEIENAVHERRRVEFQKSQQYTRKEAEEVSKLEDNLFTRKVRPLQDYAAMSIAELRSVARAQNWKRVLTRNVGRISDEELRDHLCDIIACVHEIERCDGIRCPKRCDGMISKLERNQVGRLETVCHRCLSYGMRNEKSGSVREREA